MQELARIRRFRTEIRDVEFGSGYPVIEYPSVNTTTEAGWQHESITLRPLPDDPGALRDLQVPGYFRRR